MKRHTLEQIFKPNQTTLTFSFKGQHKIQVVADHPTPWNDGTEFVVSGLAFGDEEVAIIDVEHMDFLDDAISEAAQEIKQRLAEYSEFNSFLDR